MIDPHIFIHIAKAAEEAVHETSSGPAGVLGLNIQNFLGQLVNFGILLFIFWKLILPRVTKGLQERSAKIEKSLNDAEKVAKEKQEFEIWRNAEISKARKEASEIINTSQIDATKVKEQILLEAKTQQGQLVEQAKTQIFQEKTKALQEAKSEIADIVTLATEKILKTKLDSSKDKELIKESLNNIK